MRNKNNFILGAIIGLLMSTLVTSGYFYTFYRRMMRKLREGLKKFDDLK